MSDEGAGHKSYVTKDRLGSKLLKCYQHCGSESCMMLFALYNVLRFLIKRFGSAAELAYDKRAHRMLFEVKIEFERFYRYLRYASLNTFIHLADVFWDKMVERLEDDIQQRAAGWFFDNMTKKEGHWMLMHSGPGFSNTNCSSENVERGGAWRCGPKHRGGAWCCGLKHRHDLWWL